MVSYLQSITRFAARTAERVSTGSFLDVPRYSAHSEQHRCCEDEETQINPARNYLSARKVLYIAWASRNRLRGSSVRTLLGNDGKY